MSAVLGRLSPAAPGPLTTDDAIWAHSVELAIRSLRQSAAGVIDPLVSALAVAVAAVRLEHPAAPELLQLIRRSLMRNASGSECALRCLRALARAGQPVALERLTGFLDGIGRHARMALVSTADLALAGVPGAFSLLTGALHGKLAGDAAFLLSSLQTPEALAALESLLDDEGDVGFHAARVFLAAQGRRDAFLQLISRLCDQGGQARAAQALHAANDRGDWLLQAEAYLLPLAHEGDPRAQQGIGVVSAFLTACGQRADMIAALRALGSEGDLQVLIGAQAAWWLGDADRAHLAASELVRRGPQAASQAFEVLTRWADVGDRGALALHRRLLEHRPLDLSRSSTFEAIAPCSLPAILGTLTKALNAADRAVALEAARAIARLREPRSPIPPYGL